MSVYSEADLKLYNEADVALYEAALNGSYSAPYALAGEATTTYTSSYAQLSSGYASTVAADSKPLPTPSKSAVGITGRDADILARFYWNERLQLLLERPAHSPQEVRRRNEEIAALQQRFVAMAEPVVEQIVAEVSEPLKCRTIKPLEVGGIAGGDKFIARNLFLKFCSDRRQLELYGGAHFAQKAAAHELKSLNALISAAVPGLHFPLMCVFMVRGYRVVVISKLPISGSTLVYGSADAGRTVLTDPHFDKLMRQAAAKLNLAPHPVREGGTGNVKTVAGPVDLEGHRGADARTYVCDVARLFPTTHPIKGIPGCHLYKLFRQEFVQRCAEPLSSDAFSHFGAVDAKVHNARAREAFTHLMTVAVPSAASAALTAGWRMADVKERLHTDGINLRFAGAVLLHLGTEAAAARELLMEMMCRTAKNELYGLMRSVEGGDSARRVACAAYLSRAFVAASRSAYWLSEGVAVLRQYFEFVRTPSYNDGPTVSALVEPLLTPLLADEAACVRMVQRACELAGLELSEKPLSLADVLAPERIESFKTRVKMMRFDASHYESARSFEETEQMYLEAISKAQTERGADDVQTIKHMLHLALLYSGGGRQRGKDAKEWFEKAIAASAALRGPASLTTAEIREQYVSFLASFDPALGAEQVQQVLAIKRGVASGIEVELAATLDMAAGLAAVQWRFEDALRDTQEALRLKKAHSNPADCAASTVLLGKIMFLLGRHDAAQKELEAATTTLEASSGPNDTRLAHALDVLAQNCLALGDAPRAAALLQRALALKRSSLGDLHVSVAATLDHLAVCRMRQDQRAEAAALSKEALDMITTLAGVQHHARGIALWNRALVLSGTPEAAQLHTDALHVLSTHYATTHPLMQFAASAPGPGHKWLSHPELFGWSGQSETKLGFDIQMLSPELLEVLFAAGVTLDDLKDPIQVEHIFTTLMETLAEEEEEEEKVDAEAVADVQGVEGAEGRYESLAPYTTAYASPAASYYAPASMDDESVSVAHEPTPPRVDPHDYTSDESSSSERLKKEEVAPAPAAAPPAEIALMGEVIEPVVIDEDDMDANLAEDLMGAEEVVAENSLSKKTPPRSDDSPGFFSRLFNTFKRSSSAAASPASTSVTVSDDAGGKMAARDEDDGVPPPKLVAPVKPTTPMITTSSGAASAGGGTPMPGMPGKPSPVSGRPRPITAPIAAPISQPMNVAAGPPPAAQGPPPAPIVPLPAPISAPISAPMASSEAVSLPPRRVEAPASSRVSKPTAPISRVREEGESASGKKKDVRRRKAPPAEEEKRPAPTSTRSPRAQPARKAVGPSSSSKFQAKVIPTKDVGVVTAAEVAQEQLKSTTTDAADRSRLAQKLRMKLGK